MTADTQLIPASDSEARDLTPKMEDMRRAIAECVRVDEAREIRDKAQALRIYFRQQKDVYNEINAVKIRIRAERRVGQLLAEMSERGERATRADGVNRGANRHLSQAATSAPTLSELGMTRSEAKRAMDLARVPERQFEAALSGPSPSSASVRRAGNAEPQAQAVDVRPAVHTWGTIRAFARDIEAGKFLDPAGWTKNRAIQKFQIQEIRAALPKIVDYLSRLATEE